LSRTARDNGRQPGFTRLSDQARSCGRSGVKARGRPPGCARADSGSPGPGSGASPERLITRTDTACRWRGPVGRSTTSSARPGAGFRETKHVGLGTEVGHVEHERVALPMRPAAQHCHERKSSPTDRHPSVVRRRARCTEATDGAPRAKIAQRPSLSRFDLLLQIVQRGSGIVAPVQNDAPDAVEVFNTRDWIGV
jgi:hypothetical protein